MIMNMQFLQHSFCDGSVYFYVYDLFHILFPFGRLESRNVSTYYVCTYSLMYVDVCMYLFTYLRTYVCLYVCTYVFIYVGVCIYLRIYLHMYVCTYVRGYVCVYIYIYTRTYVFRYVCIYVCRCVCICMYVRKYVRTYACTHVRMYTYVTMLYSLGHKCRNFRRKLK